ncbi:sulfotransferase family 2 domain-containing protein [uncultured Cycloclasticus sp.]|uniref:sulfotransferase family 2 domain-containing protein n=1 Tax=uncultured Cycloclasticus sp. TaxID=172194 RepID=UPI00258862DD|nr:sulfotransferase family 2 domain-containing protein [uncultured Cycloclasticus sp.]
MRIFKSSVKEIDKGEIIPAVFLHLQKTAGTTIVDLAWQKYGHAACSHGEFETTAKQVLFEKSFVSGHFGYEFAKSLILSRYSFTFLRNPVERVLSFYFFCRGRDKNERKIYKLAQSLSLDQFLRAGFDNELVKSLIWNSQVWRLACGCPNDQNKMVDDFLPNDLLRLAKEHLNSFSHIGFTENFERDRDIILGNLNMQIPQGKVVSNASKNRLLWKDIPTQTKTLLLELTELDRQLYEYAWGNRKNFKS